MPINVVRSRFGTLFTPEEVAGNKEAIEAYPGEESYA